MTDEHTHTCPSLNVPQPTSRIARASRKIQRIRMKTHTLVVTSVSDRTMDINPSISTYINIAQMSCKDSECIHPLRTPKSGSPISTTRRKIRSHRTPFNIPYRICMTAICHYIGHCLERPQPGRMIRRSTQEIFRGRGCATDRIERDGENRSGVSNQLSRS